MKKELCQEVIAVLRYHKALGIQGYPASEDVNRFVARDLHLALPANILSRVADTPPRKSKKKSSGNAEKNFAVDTVSLAELYQEIETCRQCNIGEQGSVSLVAGKPGEIKLMVIGDWPHHSSVTGSVFFGEEEDVMLKKMFKAIQLENNEVCIANVVRCMPRRDIEPRAEHISICAVFLKKQIELLKPAILCAMGNVAARILYNTGVALSRLRGRFYPYKCGNHTIPLMVTYHPSYLLKNPEMKRATWADLQLVQKKLREL